MKCPKCETLMNEITCAGVLVDVCPRCLGLWLDRGELEKTPAASVRSSATAMMRRGTVGAARRSSARTRTTPRRHPKRKRWAELLDLFD